MSPLGVKQSQGKGQSNRSRSIVAGGASERSECSIKKVLTAANSVQRARGQEIWRGLPSQLEPNKIFSRSTCKFCLLQGQPLRLGVNAFSVTESIFICCWLWALCRGWNTVWQGWVGPGWGLPAMQHHYSDTLGKQHVVCSHWFVSPAPSHFHWGWEAATVVCCALLALVVNWVIGRC